MTVQEAITKLQGIISSPKIEDGGVTAEGRFSADECNAIATVLNSLLTLGGNTNVEGADGVVLNDYVLVKRARSSVWEARTLSTIRQAVDSTIRQGSANAVSSNAVYVRVQELLNMIDDCATAEELSEAVSGKQDTLTFDQTPTANSSNPVTSNGIRQALDSKQAVLIFDEEPMAGSANPVKSGGLHTLFQTLSTGLQSCLTFSNLVQNTGSSAYSVMSQKAVTDTINSRMLPSYKYVSALPEASSETVGKLYVCPENDSLSVYVTNSDGTVYSWEKIGTIYSGGSVEGDYYES